MYLAADAAGFQVALKELVFALVPSADQIEAFLREARVLQDIRHPRVPRYLSAFQEGEGPQLRLYMAQEFVTGRSLESRAQEQRFQETEAINIARELLLILRELHGQIPPLVHRDIKPANIIERPDGSLWLVDFGAARTLQQKTHHNATFVGTVGYISPEQFGGTLNVTADLYALGATLLHLLTRRPPSDFSEDGLTLRLPDALDVSAPFRRYLERLLAPRVSDRIPSAKAALAELDAINSSSPLVPADPIPPARVSTKTAPAPTASSYLQATRLCRGCRGPIGKGQQCWGCWGFRFVALNPPYGPRPPCPECQLQKGTNFDCAACVKFITRLQLKYNVGFAILAILLSQLMKK